MIFEGRDAAGKGGSIKRITESLNPRVCRVVALPAPTEREKTQWYFQRYIEHLPAAGEMVLLDRSWYNRAGVERVMGFCTDDEYWEFMRSCPEFERMLVRSGIILMKYWFSVSDEEQERRFQARLDDPEKHWKFSLGDLDERKRWDDYTAAYEAVISRTSTSWAPWSSPAKVRPMAVEIGRQAWTGSWPRLIRTPLITSRLSMMVKMNSRTMTPWLRWLPVRSSPQPSPAMRRWPWWHRSHL